MELTQITTPRKNPTLITVGGESLFNSRKDPITASDIACRKVT